MVAVLSPGELAAAAGNTIYNSGANLANAIESAITNSYTNLFNPTPANKGVTAQGHVPNNINYQMMISQVGGGSVICNAPQQIDFTFGNQYQDLAISGLFSKELSRIENSATYSALKSLTGISLSRADTLQVWKGSSPIEISVNVILRAYSDPIADVLNPLRLLIAMAAPSEAAAGFILQSPGPTFTQQAIAAFSNGFSFGDIVNAQQAITLRIGNILTLPGLVIISMHIEWFTRAQMTSPSGAGYPGGPLACNIAITFRSFITYSRQDILQIFGGSVPGVK